jgi:hypothetical protein
VLTDKERRRRNAEKAMRAYHKRSAEIAAMPKIACGCGCETMIAPLRIQDRKPARFAPGHSLGGRGVETRFKKGQTPHNKGKPGPPNPRKGTRVAKEIIDKTIAARRAKNRGAYWKPGRTLTDVRDPDKWLDAVTKANRSRDITGPNNPFFGKTHTAETRERISNALTGERNPNWAGGASTLPYGPAFTKKFKRLIRQRDGNRCQRCGKTREKHHRALEVHHIDHDKANNDPANLITVCGSCNVWLSYHRDVALWEFPKRRLL